MSNLPKFSVVVCVYRGDNAEHFFEAIKSAEKQTITPDEIIIVADGELTPDLEQVIQKCCKKYNNIKFHQLPKNHGVGFASNYGINRCKNELIAKMDADDLLLPERFEKQLKAFKSDSDLTLLGGQLSEFADDDPKNIVSYRRVPTDLADIKKFARRRSPCNNPTVMFKKSAIQAVGGYPKLNRAEDYYLYAKLLADGYKIANLDDVLVNYRLSSDNYGRRKSWRHTKEMLHARKEIYHLGVSKRSDYLITSAAQIALFITPNCMTKLAYKILRKN